MQTISATDAKQKFAALLDAAQREPVRIQRHDRDDIRQKPSSAIDLVSGCGNPGECQEERFREANGAGPGRHLSDGMALEPSHP